jgi:serine/threonine protein kinase
MPDELLKPDPASIRKMIRRWFPGHENNRPVMIHTDTSDFFKVGYDDVVLVGQGAYLIRNNAKEGRFGIDDQEKFWVKRAIDLTDGSRKILKLVFHERFTAHIGEIAFECFRSPKKEARILSLVAGHPHFMQGTAAYDDKNNIVRILHVIAGKSLPSLIEDFGQDHEAYFYQYFPAILEEFMACIRAIRFLHENGEKHGDIRRDHILIDSASNHYRWIDFDFSYRQRENIYSYDLFGLGNILIYLVGKGDVLLPDLIRTGHPALGYLCEEDENIVFHHRVANLRKIYGYIPESLNRILLHFSKGANWYYETTGQLLEDLEDYRHGM